MEVRAILYTSATGFTERYARMLSEAAGLPACPAGGAGPPRPGEPGGLPGLALRRQGPGAGAGPGPL